MEHELLKRVQKFMIDHKVSCSEDVYQRETVSLNSEEFIDDLFKIVEDTLPILEDE